MTGPGGPGVDPNDPTRWAALPPSSPPGYPPSAPWPGYPMPAPGGYPPGEPPRRGRGWRWAVLATVCALAVGAVAFMAFTGRDKDAETADGEPTSASSLSTAAQPPVPNSAIDTLLPDKDTVGSAVNDANLHPTETQKQMGTGDTVSADCQGVDTVNSGSVYAGSGWIDVRVQRWRSPDRPDHPELTHDVVVGVVTYPRADAAAAFFAAHSATWKGCAGRSINTRPAGDSGAPDVIWSVGEVTELEDMVTTTETAEGGAGWMCRNALAVRRNVIIRADACGMTIPDTALTTIVDAVAAKIDAAG